MSVPICLAEMLKLKIFLFEPNMVIGRSNLLLLNYCDKIFTYNRKIKIYQKNDVQKFCDQTLNQKNIFLSKYRAIKNQNHLQY